MERYEETLALIKYRDLLNDRVRDLRLQACQVAKEVRKLSKLLPDDLLNELHEYEVNLVAYDIIPKTTLLCKDIQNNILNK